MERSGSCCLLTELRLVINDISGCDNLHELGSASGDQLLLLLLPSGSFFIL